MQETASAASSSGPGDGGKKGRRKQVLVACNRCRRQKTACDSARPACSSCRRVEAVCQYDTERPDERRNQALQRRYQDLTARQTQVHDDLAWLRSQSSDTVLSCVERLRNIEDPIVALSAAVAEERGRRRPPEIPAHEVLLSASAPASTSASASGSASDSVGERLTAELTVRFPATYPQILEPRFRPSQDDNAIARQFSAPDSSPSLENPGLIADYLTQEAERTRVNRALDPTLLCDLRLKRLQIASWTTVPISNELASCLISTYLRVEHPMYCFFDAESFLEDLCGHCRQHCSSLLVNALLFWTSCTYSSTFPQASMLSRLFFEAAQSQLEARDGQTSALHVASLMILSIGCICIGNSTLARDFLISGIAMAENVGLIGGRRRSAGQFKKEEMVGMQYAAWGAFNFSTVYLLHFHDVHSPTYTCSPPLLPIPIGSRTSKPNAGSRNANLDGASFPYFCQFWCIAHAAASELYRHSGPVYQHVSVAFAERQFRIFLEWAQSLPPEVRRSASMAHNVCEMHICYQATIMDLFRPFLARNARLSLFSGTTDRPDTIFLLSMRHLDVLVNTYYSTYAGLPEACTVAWVHGPLYLAPAILRYDRDPAWEVRFLRSIEACRDLLRAHAALEAFLRAILGMAISAGVFSVTEAVNHLDALKAERQDGHHPTVPDVGFVVDHDLAVQDRSAATGSVLAQRFDDELFQPSLLQSAEPA